MRKLWISIGFVVPFFLGELYLRVVDPFHYSEKEDWSQYADKVLDHGANRLRPGATGTYLGKPTKISAQGWRSPQFEVPKPAGTFRIVLLGGSVPYGWGVADGEEFPRVLERELNVRKFRGAKRIEVINTGVPGWKLPEVGALLAKEVFAWQPDMVMLLLVSTDVPRVAPAKKRSFFLSESTRRIRLLRAIENRYVFDTAGTQGRPYDSYENLPADGLARVAHSLSLFAAACKANVADAVVVDTLNADATRAACRDYGIQRIEGYVPWALRRSWEVAVTDAHPNAEGHRYYADLILRGLR